MQYPVPKVWICLEVVVSCFRNNRGDLVLKNDLMVGETKRAEGMWLGLGTTIGLLGLSNSIPVFQYSRYILLQQPWVWQIGYILLLCCGDVACLRWLKYVSTFINWSGKYVWRSLHLTWYCKWNQLKSNVLITSQAREQKKRSLANQLRTSQEILENLRPETY